MKLPSFLCLIRLMSCKVFLVCKFDLKSVDAHRYQYLKCLHTASVSICQIPHHLFIRSGTLLLRSKILYNCLQLQLVFYSEFANIHEWLIISVNITDIHRQIKSRYQSRYQEGKNGINSLTCHLPLNLSHFAHLM